SLLIRINRRWPTGNEKSTTGFAKWRNVYPMSAKRQPLNGKRVSKSTEKPSQTNGAPQFSRLEQLLAKIYHRYQRLDGAEKNRKGKQDFLFHMTDWVNDLQELAELYQHPERFDKGKAGEVVSGFLYHAVAHLRAAAKLLLDFDADAFEK